MVETYRHESKVQRYGQIYEEVRALRKETRHSVQDLRERFKEKGVIQNKDQFIVKLIAQVRCTAERECVCPPFNRLLLFSRSFVVSLARTSLSLSACSSSIFSRDGCGTVGVMNFFFTSGRFVACCFTSGFWLRPLRASLLAAVARKK